MDPKNTSASLKSGLARDVIAATDQIAAFADRFASDRNLVYEAVLLKRELSKAQGAPANDFTGRAAALVDQILVDFERGDGSDATARREALERVAEEARQIPVPDAVVFTCNGLGTSFRRGGFELRDVSLDLKLGRITGVVGRNGNGKTTFFRLVVGELSPKSGTLGFPALLPAGGRLRWSTVRQQIAYVPQELSRVFGSLRSNLHYEAAIHGIVGKDNLREVDFIIERLGLADELEKRWHELSGGYKLRFSLARALVWKPKLLILDEPLANLDFAAQQVVLRDIRHLADSLRYPLAVLISSQHLHEIEEVSDDILFLKRGSVVFSGAITDIGKQRTKNRFEVGGSMSLAALQSVLAGPRYHQVYYSGVSFVITATLDVTGPALLKTLLEAGIEVDYFRDNSRGVKSLFEEGPSEF